MSTTSSSSGIGFCGLLTIVFIVLKLTGYISWSWWLVLLPVLIPMVLVIALIVIAIISKNASPCGVSNMARKVYRDNGVEARAGRHTCSTRPGVILQRKPY